MLINNSLTIYHKKFDNNSKTEKWIRFNYDKVWYFGGRGAGINKGYDNANDVEVRIFYKLNDTLDVKNFSIGDIIVAGTLTQNISKQQDLKGYEIYNITSINDNKFGTKPHIHIGGR